MNRSRFRESGRLADRALRGWVFMGLKQEGRKRCGSWGLFRVEVDGWIGGVRVEASTMTYCAENEFNERSVLLEL